ncbi:MAG: DUF2938 family protein [Candidatus Tectomicrobia bacterium]|uniref:DUF2938 family protein n=1 Tax=Tectimicrobiota bacterium TaxID=2528274 RepID=A0A933GP38_UNCTE|nr:DUF2938 family protein [Candidatus Tectomicrobia bacterium]
MICQVIRIVKGGIMATAVMTLVMLMAPLMGLPKMPVGSMLANFMHIPVSMGWMMHFIIGTTLAAAYVFLFQTRVSVHPAVNGMLFSLIPFLLAQIMVNPIMGAGFFALKTPAPFLMVMGSLVGHLVYGAVLGFTTRESRGSVGKACFLDRESVA